MTENISYDYIWQAYQKEKQTNQLLLISKNFYDEVAIFINNTKIESKDNRLIIENTSRITADFFEKRKQKILVYVAYNKQLPQPIGANETEFYNKILQIVKSEKLDLSNFKKDQCTMKSIKDIPEIILPSGNKIGPLKMDQTLDIINEQDQTYLIQNAICEKIN
ncbi:MAG: hypothetical protein ACREBH_03090 [Candidatus Micrarchaeaceae archaeon]